MLQRPSAVSIVSHSTLTRRRFLLVTSSYLAATSCVDAPVRDDAAAEGIELDQFIRISRVLTEVSDMGDESSGRQYLAALLGDPERARQLVALWRAGGFESPNPPDSVADLAARGVYEMPDLAGLADLITGNWYSGTYVTADGELGVATYVDALAWRTLGYRSTGPSACGGVFGHWADKPPGA